MNILITSAGQRVSLVRAFQAELHKIDGRGKVYAADLNTFLSPACHVAEASFAVTPVTNSNYISGLIELCLKQKIQMVLPTIDTELQTLSESLESFRSNGIHCVVSTPNFVKVCRSKRQTAAFFNSREIPTAKEIDKFNPTFPLFIKPDNGSLSVDTFIIRKASELTEYHFDNEKLLFMEYFDKESFDEFTVDMYYGKDGFLKCVVPRMRIKVRAGEVNKAVTRNNKLVPFLKDRLGYIEGAVGCLTAQFFLGKESNEIIGIEINPRFGGGYPLSYQAGANFPAWLIKEYFLNEPIEYTEDWERDLLMLRYDDEVIVHGYPN